MLHVNACGSFNCAVCSHTASNDGMINELEGMWEEAAVA
jgi:hypothetical protein